MRFHHIPLVLRVSYASWLQEQQQEEQEEEGIVVEQEEKKDWTSARLIFGRLIAIDKKQSQLTFEYKEANGEWTTETFTAEWSDPEFDEALEDLGSDITLKVIDNEAIDYEVEE